MKTDVDLWAERGAQCIEHEWRWSLFIHSPIQQSQYSSDPGPHRAIGGAEDAIVPKKKKGEIFLQGIYIPVGDDRIKIKNIHKVR